MRLGKGVGLVLAMVCAVTETTMTQERAIPHSIEVLVIAPGADVLTAEPIASRVTDIGIVPMPPVSTGEPPAAIVPTDRCGFATSVGDGPLVDPTEVEFDNPYDAATKCRARLPENLPSGRGYRAVGVFTAPYCTDGSGQVVTPCRSSRTLALASDGSAAVFQVGTVDQCAADQAGRRPVVLSVGDWTRSAAPGNSARVLYSLTSSRDPVVTVVVKLNDAEQGRLSGTDLRQVAGSYFTLPPFAGSYRVSVSALTQLGCEDGGNRPMTIVVK